MPCVIAKNHEIRTPSPALLQQNRRDIAVPGVDNQRMAVNASQYEKILSTGKRRLRPAF